MPSHHSVPKSPSIWQRLVAVLGPSEPDQHEHLPTERPIERAHRKMFRKMSKVEVQRALLLLQAQVRRRDKKALRDLLAFASPDKDMPTLVADTPNAIALAWAFSNRRLPLTDAGVARFKARRGLVPGLRFDDSTIAAYLRYVRGREVLLNVDEDEWQSFTDEERRALRLLLHIGRDPESLAQLRRVLDIKDAEGVQPGLMYVGRASVERLIAWLKPYGIRLTRPCLARLMVCFSETPHGHSRDSNTSAIRSVYSQLIADLITSSADEPKHDYEHVLSNGRTINRRTSLMLRQAELRLKRPLLITQGSYRHFGGRGAHPHMGGGVVDIDVEGFCEDDIERAVWILRSVGFAAWMRKRPNNHHIHAVAIGDRELSPAAYWQVKSYFQGRDGRSRQNPDPHGGPLGLNHLPHWVRKYYFAALHSES